MILTTDDLSVTDRLTGVSLALEPGRITAICGPNGAGKSTLIGALAGLIAPTSGSVSLDGRDLDDLHPRERGRTIGYLPQAAEVAWDVPVRSLVELGRMPHGDRRSSPVNAALEALDLRELEHRRAQSLSGGETARVLLARVLAGEPRWILADEPFAALDLAHQHALIGHLGDAAAGGAGVVVVLHDLALAMNHADRVVVLDRGQVAADGPSEVALAPEMIAKVWNFDIRWLGSAGARALVRA